MSASRKAVYSCSFFCSLLVHRTQLGYVFMSFCALSVHSYLLALAKFVQQSTGYTTMQYICYTLGQMGLMY